MLGKVYRFPACLWMIGILTLSFTVLISWNFLFFSTQPVWIIGVHKVSGHALEGSINNSINSTPVLEETTMHISNSCTANFRIKKQLTIPKPLIKEVSCHKLFSGVKTVQKNVKVALQSWTPDINDEDFLNKYSNCTFARSDFDNNFYVPSREANFPLAFEMLIYYKNVRVQQYLRLLKFLYRSHNAYCIHMDDKSPNWWKEKIHEFASCFPNIIIAKKPVQVTYATATILYAHMQCFRDLLRSSLPWKYVISLHATEVPLVTNLEMVDVLHQLQGSNLIQPGENASNPKSFSHQWILHEVVSIRKGTWVTMSEKKLPPPPYNITPFKSGSSANSAVTRAFIEFVLTNDKVVAFSKWLNKVHSAVEFFFATVNRFPDAPGGFHTLLDKNVLVPKEIAHREWIQSIKTNHKLCVNLKIVHELCIVSASDLPRLKEASQTGAWWFFNKYFMEYDHIVMNCMEKLLLERNYQQYKIDCPS